MSTSSSVSTAEFDNKIKNGICWRRSRCCQVTTKRMVSKWPLLPRQPTKVRILGSQISKTKRLEKGGIRQVYPPLLHQPAQPDSCHPQQRACTGTSWVGSRPNTGPHPPILGTSCPFAHWGTWVYGPDVRSRNGVDGGKQQGGMGRQAPPGACHFTHASHPLEGWRHTRR